MRLLLDTHALLRFRTADPRLSPKATEHIENTTNDLFLSMAAIWELAIKISNGRLKVDLPLPEFVEQRLPSSRMEIVPVTLADIFQIVELPHHHRDPFARMMVAQCKVNKLA